MIWIVGFAPLLTSLFIILKWKPFVSIIERYEISKLGIVITFIFLLIFMAVFIQGNDCDVVAVILLAFIMVAGMAGKMFYLALLFKHKENRNW